MCITFDFALTISDFLDDDLKSLSILVPVTYCSVECKYCGYDSFNQEKTLSYSRTHWRMIFIFSNLRFGTT